MKSYYVFLSPEDGALTLVSANNPNFIDYEERLTEIFVGSRKECVTYIEEYQDENFIPDGELLVNYLN